MRIKNENDVKSLERGLQAQVRQHVLAYKKLHPAASLLSRVELLSFVQERDHALARRKRLLLEKAIESICIELEQNSIDITMHSEDEVIDALSVPTNPDASASLQPVVSPRLAANAASTMSKRKANDGDSVDHKKPKVNIQTSEEFSSGSSPPSSVRLEDLGGIDSSLSQILETIVLPLSQPALYTRLGIALPRGVLLHGPPGCGKTALANAIANELEVPFVSISAPSIVSGMSGESEKKVREIFSEAIRLAPCLIFIDEIDAVTPKRETAQREMERRIVAQFLTCMDDLSLEKTCGRPVMVIGATNRPDSLDPALRRAGRFDREICLGVPDESAREAILQIMCRKLRLAMELDLGQLARSTAGYVGADLSALVAAAGVQAIKRIMSAAVDITQTSIDQSQIPDKSSSSDLSTMLRLYRGDLSTTLVDSIYIEASDFVRALKLIQPSAKREGFTTVPDTTWADIGALHDVRAELEMAIVKPIRHPEMYRALGISTASGVLLWGPPGCGKTLLAKAVANESHANFISIRGPELLNKYVGESERAVRQVFSRARASSPCVIFFDELDALVPRRDDSLSESSSRVVNTLLTELDGLEDRKSVFVIGATNRPDMIDPAMLRPGRLDKPLFVRLPSAHERFDILKALVKDKPLENDVQLDNIAADSRASNYSGADLAALVREAAVVALRSRFNMLQHDASLEQTSSFQHKLSINHEDFQAAFEKVRPSVSDSQRSKYEKLRLQYSL